MPTVTHTQTDSKDTVAYDARTGETILTRTFQVLGAYPIDTPRVFGADLPSSVPAALAAGTYPPITDGSGIPYYDVVFVKAKDVIGWRAAFSAHPATVEYEVYCYAVSYLVKTVRASADYNNALSSVEVTYRGYRTGLLYDETTIGTRSELIVADMEISKRDPTTHVAQGIGPSQEGTNRQVPVETWNVYENITLDWYTGLGGVKAVSAYLAGSLNQENWRPVMLGKSAQPQGYWLYLGATFSPLGEFDYRVKHSFIKATLYDRSQFVKGPVGTIDWINSRNGYVYRHKRPAEKEISDNLDEDTGAPTGTAKTKIQGSQWGEQKVAAIYPLAGDKNIIGGRDLSLYNFDDLGI